MTTENNLHKLAAGMTDQELAAALDDADDESESEDSIEPPQKVHRLEIAAKPGDEAKAIAQAFLRPSVKTATTMLEWGGRGRFADVNYMEVVRELQAQAATVSRNELGRCEATLVMQATTLDLIFHDLLRRARLNAGEYLDAFERYMRLALKAQAQSRATLETLAEIKNPKPVAFVKQANIAAGPQQVNNGRTASGEFPQQYARAEDTNQSNKLLETLHESRLDTRAPSTTVGTDPQLETVGTIDGTADARRKGENKQECKQARRTQS